MLFCKSFFLSRCIIFCKRINFEIYYSRYERVANICIKFLSNLGKLLQNQSMLKQTFNLLLFNTKIRIKVDDHYRKNEVYEWKTHIKGRWWNFLTLTEVSVIQKKVNVCEHTVKMVPHDSFGKSLQEKEVWEWREKRKRVIIGG